MNDALAPLALDVVAERFSKMVDNEASGPVAVCTPILAHKVTNELLMLAAAVLDGLSACSDIFFLQFKNSRRWLVIRLRAQTRGL